MPAQLVGVVDGSSILLDKPILLLGRDPECDILIESRKISRRHCCIAQVNDHLVIRDLGSTNGIRVNGERVLEGTLRHGDEVTIGNQNYRVAWDSAAPGGADAPPSAGRIDDAVLESCDEPVPLSEPDERHLSLPSNILPAVPPADQPPRHVLPANGPLPGVSEPASTPPPG